MNKWQHRTSKLFKRAVLAVILTGLAASLHPVATVNADATKAVNSSVKTYHPNQQVPFQITFSPPPTRYQSIEVVFVVDSSGSMASEIADARAQIKSFADWAYKNYPGSTKVGVISFGKTDGVRDDIPFIRYHTRSGSNDSCNHNCGQLWSLNNASQYNNLANRVDAEVGANPSPGGFSDITEGIRRGNALLNSGTSANKYLVLISDGFVNMPASGTTFSAGGGAFNGKCMLMINAGNRVPDYANIGSRQWDEFFISAATSSSTQYNQLLPRSGAYIPGLSNYKAPCEGYMSYVGTLRGSGILNHIDSYFPGASSVAISSAITRLKRIVTPSSLIFEDVVNTSVFNGGSVTISGAGLYNCTSTTGSGAPRLSGSGYNITINGRIITVTAPYSSSITRYCVRFNAKVSSSPTFGTVSLNSPGHRPANCMTVNPVTQNVSVIQYKNQLGQVISCDRISNGSVTIQPNGDLRAGNLMLTNATSDTARRVFRTTDNIYVRGVVRNDNPILAGARTAFYTNRTSTAHGASSDIPLTINHGAIGTNQTLWYASRPGGLRNTQMSGTKYFRKSAGDYSAQMHVNYTRSVTETNYSNNTFNYNYSVIAAPTNPRTTNILCTSANIGWNHAANSNIDRYTVSLTGSGNVGSVTNNSARLTNLSPNTTYTWSLSAAATHGTLGNVLSDTFRTPHCPYITASNSGPIAINPGQLTASILDVNLTYHPDSNGNNWSSYGQANIAINVVAIRPNGASCSGLTATSPRYSSGSDGLQVRASGTSVSGTTLQSTTAKASFDVTSSSNTNTGRYTVCFGISSSANWVGRQPIPVMPAYIDVELRPWLQIDSPTELYQDVWRNSEAGDVHSNGPMTINVPIHHYFFRNGVAGVLSHPESQSIRPPSRLAINYTMRQVLWTYVPVQISPWKASLYDQPVTTRSFDQLRKLAQSSLDNPAENFQEVNPATTNFNSLCAQGGGVYYFKPSGGTLTRNAAQNLSSHPQCANNRNLLFFIDGNLTHNQNLIDDTLSSTITFIVNGDIRVSPSVTRLDGVHIFSGSFSSGSRHNTRTGTADQQLVINGSLIGLAGTSPTSSTGSFAPGSDYGLARNLSHGSGGNDHKPAELIRYQPKYLFALRELLGQSTFTWIE